MFRTSQKYLWKSSSSAGDCFHPYGNVIISTIQPHRTIVLSSCRYKSANLKSRNYYELLGIEKTATQKEIKKAFVKLSKEYHPDSNSADKSLHEKFVKINEAFTVLSKESTRNTYDQSLNSPFGYASPNWSNINSRPRGSYQRPAEAYWNGPNPDKAFYEMYRRRMEQDRQRYNSHAYYSSTSHQFRTTYFAPASVVLILIGFGMFIHALQWRMMRYADPQYAFDPRSRHYRAYREWQRMSGVKDQENNSSKRRQIFSSIMNEEEEEEENNNEE